MAELSKILDELIERKTKLEVKAISVDARRPLNLEVVLIAYDHDGFLYKRNFTDNYFYIPRTAVASMRFSSEILVEDHKYAKAENSTPFSGSTRYDVENRVLVRGNLRETARSEFDHQALILLFQNTAKPASYQKFAGLLETGDANELNNKSNVELRNRIFRLRKTLGRVGLTVCAKHGEGYILREL